jgi:hypothetical protein
MSGVKVNLPVLEWSGEGVDLEKLFDNSNGRQSEAQVYTDKEVLVYGTDFTVDEIENGEAKVQLSAGEHTIVLRGTAAADGNCCVGEKNVTLNVKGIDASKVKVACFDTKPEYLGRAFTLEDLYLPDSSGYKTVTLYTEAGGQKTVLGAGDYSVDMSKARASGTFDIVFSLKNGYTGTKKMTVNVRPYNINKNRRNDVVVNVSDADYRKSGAVPSVTVTVGGVTLHEGIDYSLTCKKNVKISDVPGNEPRVVIRGKGNYTGSVKKTFKVNKISISNASLFVADKKYKSDAGAGYFKSLPTVVDDNVTLKKKRDYNKFTLDDCSFCYAETGIPIKDTERVPAGTLIEVRVVVSCPETSQYTGSATLRGCYRLIPAEKNIKKAKVTVTDPDAFVFRNGQELIPAKATDLKVTLDSQIVPSSGYEIVSVKNNRFIGTATVIIEGRGDYGGMKKFTFLVKARKIPAVLE